jgi:ribonuclease HI
VRWAIASAQAFPGIPTATTFLLPDDPKSPYQALLGHSLVRELCTVDGNADNRMVGDAGGWALPVDRGTAPTARDAFRLKLLMVANDLGVEELCHTGTPEGLLQLLDQTLDKELCQRGAWKELTRRGHPLKWPSVRQVTAGTTSTVRIPAARKLLLRTAPATVAGAAPLLPVQTEAETQVALRSRGCNPEHKLRLKYDANDCYYTDGSCKNEEDGPNKLGAAVYHAGTQQYITVQPNGCGTTNTITRAELSAIHALLDSDNAQIVRTMHIFTDSMASLCLIRKALHSEHLIRMSKHAALLRNIKTCLLRRADQGFHTHLHKVKSHIGISGNEAADKAAQDVADGKEPPRVTETSENNPYDHIWWIRAGGTYAANLNAWLKTSVASTTAAGYSKVGVYATLWANQLDGLCAKSSHRMWTCSKVPFADALQIFKSRWGHLYNAKLAARYGKHPTHQAFNASEAPCPLCGCPDSGSHILGGCKREDMHRLYIKRHNTAVQIIAEYIQNGSLGGCAMYMDACAAKDMPDYAMGTRLDHAEWLLPNRSEAQRKPMRPDILLVEGVQAKDAKRPDFAPRRERGSDLYKVHVLEVGYTSDTNHEAKCVVKQGQHAELVAALEQEGWHVNYPKHAAITLGTGGTVRKDLAVALRELGVAQDKTAECMQRLHLHSVLTAAEIIKLRRFLEYGGRGPSGPGPPRPRGGQQAP